MSERWNTLETENNSMTIDLSEEGEEEEDLYNH
jgi:hypothetical protein